MLTFSAPSQARFSYRATFQQQPYANISFYDRAGDHIRFHLSLRPDDGMAVCNRRDGTVWGREMTQQVTLPRDGVQVDILFDTPRLQVRIDGTEVFRFGGALSRTRLAGLERIRFVDFQGGVLPGSIDIDIAGGLSEDGVMRLTDRLELRASLPTPPAGPLHLAVDDMPAPPQPILSPGPNGTTLLRMILPGRAWLQAQDALNIRLYEGQNPDPVSRLQLTRQGLTAVLDRVLSHHDLSGDVFAATQVLEHVRFAGLTQALSPVAQRALGQLAAHYRLSGFLYPEGPPALPPPPAPAPDPQATLRDTALASIGARHWQGGPLSDLLEDLPPEGLARQTCLLTLSDRFCRDDAFDQLAACAGPGFADALADPTPPTAADLQMARDKGLVEAACDSLIPYFDEPVWPLSGFLPFLYRAGRFEALHAALHRMTQEREDWMMLAPLGWILRDAHNTPATPPALRRALLSGFMAFIDTRCDSYWERTPSTTLIDTTVALLGQAHRWADPDRRQFQGFALRAYGLSRHFWAQLPAETPVLADPSFRAARQAATTLLARNAPVTDPARLDAALALFEQARNADAARLRHELLGPDGTRPPPDLASLLQTGQNPAQTALRHLAFPGGPSPDPDLDPDLAATLRAALPAHLPDVPHSPWASLQDRVSRQAWSLLHAPETQPDMTTLAADMAALTDAGLGVALALALMAGLQEADRTDDANRWQGPLMALLDQHTPTCQPAVGTALARALASAPPERAAQITTRLGTVQTPAQPPAGSPLFDTLVVIFSCRAHLDSRLPAIRAAWVDDLAALGVPYVIVVGDGDGTQTGDVVHLDAPDDYEGLPQKTLAALRWFETHSAAGHLLKIDDDCFLNADSFFHSLSHRKFDYYGRVLNRRVAQMDRAWHCAKSTTPRGRLELDKSPEPSSYCDGGSGYALSRRAVRAALHWAARPEGLQLIQTSFMEDKLLGDLLSLAGIAPSQEDYHITIRRRERATGPTVPRWMNGFDASTVNPVKLVHLDDTGALPGARTTLTQPVLTPPRIWPGVRPAHMGPHSNALELISPAHRLRGARAAPLSVITVLRNEMFMLPHFLAHYRALGVESFLVADNCSDDGTLEYLLEQPDVAVFSVDTDYARSHYGVDWQQALIGAFRVGRWSLVVDADELLVLPEGLLDVTALLAHPALAHADALRGFLLDMYPGGPLEAADFASGDPFGDAGFLDRDPMRTNSMGRGPFCNAPTWTSALRHRLMPGARGELFVAQKYPLMRYHPAMRLSAGLHYLGEATVAAPELLLAHFKYNADFRRKAQAEVIRRQHFNNAEEYSKYLALMSEGRDVIHDPALSVPWRDADFVKKRLSWD